MSKLGDLSKGIGSELKQMGGVAAQQIAPHKPAQNALEQDQSKKVEQEHAPKDQSIQDNKDMLQALYGTSGQEQQQKQPEKKLSPEEEAFQKTLEGKTPEEQQELIQKRQELQRMHTSDYYQPLVQKVEQGLKRPEDNERAAERVERQQMEDLQEKQKEEEKKQPISVNRAQQSIESDKSMKG